MRSIGDVVPATGYSYVDLYLMGLISAEDVLDFFILTDLPKVGADINGHPIFRAKRTKVSIADVISAEGPRVPDVNYSQRKFSTGVVIVVEHAQRPTPNSSNPQTAFAATATPGYIKRGNSEVVIESCKAIHDDFATLYRSRHHHCCGTRLLRMVGPEHVGIGLDMGVPAALYRKTQLATQI